MMQHQSTLSVSKGSGCLLGIWESSRSLGFSYPDAQHTSFCQSTKANKETGRFLGILFSINLQSLQKFQKMQILEWPKRFYLYSIIYMFCIVQRSKICKTEIFLLHLFCILYYLHFYIGLFWLQTLAPRQFVATFQLQFACFCKASEKYLQNKSWLSIQVNLKVIRSYCPDGRVEGLPPSSPGFNLCLCQVKVAVFSDMVFTSIHTLHRALGCNTPFI